MASEDSISESPREEEEDDDVIAPFFIIKALLNVMFLALCVEVAVVI